MIAVWVVIAVAVVALLATAVVTGARRRARHPSGPAPRLPAEGPSRPPPTLPTSLQGAGTPAPTGAPAPADPPAPADVAVPPAPGEEAAPPGPPTFRDRLGKARSLFGGVVTSLRARGGVDAATWEQLEEALIRADVGVGATERVLARLRERVAAREVAGGEQLVQALRQDLVALLSGMPAPGASGGRRP